MMARAASDRPWPSPAPGFDPQYQRRRRGLGWLLAAVLGVGLALPLINVALVAHARPRVVGDGKNVASYGFDLSTFRGDRTLLAAGGMPRDYLPALDHPTTMHPADLPGLNDQLVAAQKGKFLVGSDRVIGVEVHGAARAYPLRVLNWHELVNDTLGGVPIAVTYNGLCDSVAVFDRRVAGRTLRLASSGLLYNSNLVFYDRPATPGDRPSLWCQLEARAIAGPASTPDASVLTVLPCRLTRYDHWLADHPQTTIVRGDPDYGLERYNTDPFDLYYLRGQLRFPVAPFPSASAPMTPILALRTTGAWHMLPISVIAEHAGPNGAWRIEIDGQPVLIHSDGEARSAWAESLDPQHPAAALYSRWFAWHALYDDTGVLR